MTGRGGPAARALGFAGLLPQVAAVALMLRSDTGALGFVVALLYGALILSFLGGIWWGFAMQRAADQAQLAALAVLPSLVAFAILGLNIWSTLSAAAALALLGVAILLTLAVDARLMHRGEAPAGWLRLRIPLSVGLGGLTLLAAALTHAIVVF